MNAGQHVMMISTHGYVAGSPVLGKPDTGGQVVYVLELSKCLARMGCQVDVLTRRFEDQPEVEPVADGVRIVRYRCGGDAFIPKETLCKHIPEWVDRAQRDLRGRGVRPTAIISHYWDAGLAGCALAKRLGIPHVHVPHSLGAWKRDNMDGDPAELERRYNFRRRIRDEQVIYGDCGALVATTPIQRGILADSTYGVPFGKVHVIPPGYDDSRFFPVSAATRAALRRQHGYSGRIVLALGRMARNKGYDLLVAAMPTVLQRVADARLLLALGAAEPTPDERAAIAELRSAAEALGIAEHVIFRDYIPDEALPDYYRLADVFALSSRYEPFGMTAVEAMACGTPTVVTTEGGLWEQVIWGLEALYANPFDPEAFGHALCTILQRPRVAAQLARHGSHRARASFAWMGIAQQVLAVLERLHARPGRARQPALEPVAAEEPAWRLPYSTSAT